MLENLSIVLCRPKYSENIGSVARACINMGCSNLVLVNPKEFDLNKALPLATPKGKKILEKAAFFSDLRLALAEFNRVYATTARTGGWRKAVLYPEEASDQILKELSQGAKVAIVFGPEDAGLTNEEIKICGQIITIPTYKEAKSLNVAQAVLIILYEIFKRTRQSPIPSNVRLGNNFATHEDLLKLYENIKQALLDIDFIKKENTEYFLMPVKRFIQRINLRKHEYNMLMGICRQIRWLKSLVNKGEKNECVE